MTTTTLPDGELQKLLVRMYMELWEKCNDPYFNPNESDYTCWDHASDNSPLTYQYSYTVTISDDYLDVAIFIYSAFLKEWDKEEWELLPLSDESKKFFDDRLPLYDDLHRQHEWLQDDHPHFASPKVVDLKTVQSFSDFCLWAEDNAIDDNDVMEEAIRKEGFIL
ncbi:MAG: hypothetical protein IJ539_01225 [Prevotella sp.]|nr:hypothetical protein [Prevotella sp.]